jgi:predicted restriction endonuclease
MKTLFRRGLLPACVVICLSRAALAVPTNEDILRSFNENMDQAPDYSRLIPWVCILAGIVAVVIFFRQRQKRQAIPKALNHRGKLLKEMVRSIETDPAEMKRISGLARELDCENPLTLLLCPSLLNKPAATAEPDHSIP